MQTSRRKVWPCPALNKHAQAIRRIRSENPADSVPVSAVRTYLMRWKDLPEEAVYSVEAWVKNGYSQDPTVRFGASDR